jgi:hypothetical protein
MTLTVFYYMLIFYWSRILAWQRMVSFKVSFHAQLSLLPLLATLLEPSPLGLLVEGAVNLRNQICQFTHKVSYASSVLLLTKSSLSF